MRRRYVLLLFSLVTVALTINLFGLKKINADDKISNIMKKYDLQKEYAFSKDEIKIAHQSENVCEKDGKKAATILSKLAAKDAYLEAVDEILQQYYADDENLSSELDEFTSNLDKSAYSLVKEYRDAWNERMNSDNLNYSTDNILVSFDASVGNDEIEEILSVVADGGTVISGMYEPDENLSEEKKKKIEQIEKESPTKTVSVNLKKNQTAEAGIKALERISVVKDAEVNNIRKAVSYKMNDDFYSFQWYADDINLENAWTSVDNANIANEIFVAALEAGIDLSHPDLKRNIINKYSVDVTGDNPILLSSMPKPYLDSHGTLVGGIIAATANNSMGVAGIAGIRSKQNNFECRLMTVNCFKKDTPQPTCSTEDVAKAIEYAISKGAEVINMSFGGYGYSNRENDAIQKAYKNGIVCVGAAGNERTTAPFYPADYEHVISVISTSTDNTKSYYSNYSNKDISAPGDYIWTTTLGDGYEQQSGTSLAAPMVSATVALMKSVNYDLTPDEIEEILYKTATDIGKKGYDDKTANGLLNVGLAVRMAKWYTYKDKKLVIKSITPKSKSITVKWNVIANEEQYEIWRSTSKNGTYSKLGVMKVNGESSMYYKDTDVKTGKRYYYKIRCRNKYANSFKYSSFSGIKSGIIS